MTPESFAPRDVVRLNYRGKERWAVVLRVESDEVVVFTCTSVERNLPCVRVEERSRDATALQLSCTSYFYENGALLVDASDLAHRGRKCPPALFNELRALAGL